MKSPLKSIVVYDLETGGLSELVNSITELAFVSIDLETLEIHEKKSILVKPYIDFSDIYEMGARHTVRNYIYKKLSVLDDETKRSTLLYKGKQLAVNETKELEEDLELYLKNNEKLFKKTKLIIELPTILELLKDLDTHHITKMMFNNAYNPEEVIH